MSVGGAGLPYLPCESESIRLSHHGRHMPTLAEVLVNPRADAKPSAVCPDPDPDPRLPIIVSVNDRCLYKLPWRTNRDVDDVIRLWLLRVDVAFDLLLSSRRFFSSRQRKPRDAQERKSGGSLEKPKIQLGGNVAQCLHRHRIHGDRFCLSRAEACRLRAPRPSYFRGH